MAEHVGALVIKLSLDSSEYTAPLQKGVQEAQKLGTTANAGFSQAAMSAKAYSAAMRGVPAQVTDIVTSLQGGQRPLTVLMQQGGQLKDMFGGIVPAAKAMGSYLAGMLPTLVHPITLLAAGIAGLGYAAYQAREQIQELTKARITTGNITGMTSEAVAAMADEVGELTGKYALAREAAQALLASGQISAGQMKVAMQGLTDGAAVTGLSVKDLAEKLVDISKDPTDSIVKLNEKYNFLTLDIYKQIESLEEQGKKQEAAKVAFEAFANAMAERRGEIKENLGLIESAWKSITSAIQGAWAAALQFGRANTKAQEIAEWEANLANMQAAWSSGANRTQGNADRIAAARAYIDVLKQEAQAKADSNKKDGEKAELNKKLIAGERDLKTFVEANKQQTKEVAIEKLDKEFAKATAMFAEGTDQYERAVAAYNTGIDKINKQFEKKGSKSSSPLESAENAFKREAAGIDFAIKNFDRFEGKVQSAKEAMAEFDVTYGKFSDAARQKAKLPVLTDEQKAGYIEEAKKLDELHDKLRRVNVVKEFGKAINDFFYDEAKHRDGMQFEIDMLGKTSLEVARLTEARRIDLLVQERIHAVRQKYGKDTSDEVQKRMADEIARISSGAEEAKRKAQALVDIKYNEDRDPFVQMRRALNAYAEDASNIGKQLGDVMTNALKRTEDALVEFVMKGKLNFRSLAESIIADLIRIQIRSQMAGVTSWLGDLLGIGGGSASVVSSGVTSNMNGFTTDLYSLGGGIAGYRASGGPVSAGSTYLVGERGPELFTPGTSGAIVPNHALGGTMKISINHKNEGTQQQVVDSSADFNGDELVISIVTRDIENNGRLAASMQRNYGLNRAAGAY